MRGGTASFAAISCSVVFKTSQVSFSACAFRPCALLCMHSLLGAIMCSQDYNYGQSSYGRCTATGCRCPSMLYLLSGAECTCSSRRGVNRWPDSGRVLYACAPRYSKDLALRMQCVRNTERNRAPLSRFLGFNMTCMAGADREPFWLPRKACMPVQMTVSQNRVKPVHLGLDLTESVYY